MPRGLIVNRAIVGRRVDVRHDRRILQNLREQRTIAANRDMPNLPVTSRHRRPQPGQKVAGAERKQARLIHDHKVIAAGMARVFVCADSVSSVPVADSMTPGYGDRRTFTSSPDASAISATCRRSSAALPLSKLATAPRQPGRRSGPHR